MPWLIEGSSQARCLRACRTVEARPGSSGPSTRRQGVLNSGLEKYRMDLLAS